MTPSSSDCLLLAILLLAVAIGGDFETTPGNEEECIHVDIIDFEALLTKFRKMDTNSTPETVSAYHRERREIVDLTTPVIADNLTMCGLSEQLVQLGPHPDEGKFFPNRYLRINRCGGFCRSDRMICKANETETVRFRINVNKNKESKKTDDPPTEVNQKKTPTEVICVTQHVRCRPACRKCKPPRDKLDPKTCGCSCPEHPSCPEYEKWNSTKCECVCKTSCRWNEKFGENCTCVPDSDLTNRLQQKMKPAVFPGWGVNYAGPEG